MLGTKVWIVEIVNIGSAFVLVLAILTIEGSYRENAERPATGAPDTVQFWLGPESQWRVKTFAIDHDIHRHSIGRGKDGEGLTVEFVEANIRKTYGDVVERMVVLRFSDPNDLESVTAVLRAEGLSGTLEVSGNGFAFYNPDSAKYWSQSEPQ